MKTHDFNDGNGPVPAHQHKNGGGWVANTATVDESAYVGPDAKVYGNAKVSENARICENAHIYESAWVSGEVQIFGNARLFGEAWVYENAQIFGDAQICENMCVCRNMRDEDARVSGNVTVDWDYPPNPKKESFVIYESNEETLITTKTMEKETLQEWFVEGKRNVENYHRTEIEGATVQIKAQMNIRG